MSNVDILIRFGVAILVSGAIGWERENSGRPAGLRTHVLVGFGACLVMLCGSYLTALNGAIDPTRMAAQVVSGLGFLGAGTIIHEGPTIKGLTTAATLWTVGCIGIAAGAGFYVGAIVAGVLALVSLIGFEKIERKRGNKAEQHIFVMLEYAAATVIQNHVQVIAAEFNLEIRNIGMQSIKGNMHQINFELISFPRTKTITNFDSLAQRLKEIPSVENFSLEERNI
ncbi:MAG: MgtC/SapB family protein [Pseudomonadota bacterium]